MPDQLPRGKFISLEGPEGSGKSTQAHLLKEWLEAQGLTVLLTREPGGTPTGEIIRNLLQHESSGEAITVPAELLLFAASRAQLVGNLIRPALERGEWVLCDRFIDSSLAYQGYGRETSVEWLLELNGFAIDGLWPDATLLFDIPVRDSLKRLAGRSESPDRFELEEIAFHERVLDGYHRLAKRFSDRYRLVDADGAVAAIHTRVKEAVAPLLGAEGCAE